MNLLNVNPISTPSLGVVIDRVVTGGHFDSETKKEFRMSLEKANLESVHGFGYAQLRPSSH